MPFILCDYRDFHLAERLSQPTIDTRIQHSKEGPTKNMAKKIPLFKNEDEVDLHLNRKELSNE